jgi:signal transduction histidine kinase
MNIAQLKLRQKMLLLIVGVGGIGLTAFVLVLALADQHLFERFVPENRALRDVESRSALLIQNYYRFMLTPEIISQDELDSSLVLIRQSLDKYRQLVSGQVQKEEFSAAILESLNGLELAGRKMVVARESFEQVFARQEGLELEIDLVFKQYQKQVSVDIGHSIEHENWQALSRTYLPELRMIETVNQQLLSLFLEIRGYQIAPNDDTVDSINRLNERIKSSTSLLEIHVVSSDARSEKANDILMVFEKMITVVGKLTRSRKEAEFAVSRAEQSGIDLNQAIVAAIVLADTDGQKQLREALLLSGGILLFTLVVSYLLLYTGLNRIISPLEKLQSIIRRLGRGDWHQRADFHREDEIGKLADTFNQMADRLEEDALEKQQLIDQLEQKNTELERFTYTVSHELKSPLITVNGFLGLLEKDMAANHAERIRDDMNKISLAVDVMSEQLDDLLELSRMGQTVTQATGFSLSELCRDVAEIMQVLIVDLQ